MPRAPEKTEDEIVEAKPARRRAAPKTKVVAKKAAPKKTAAKRKAAPKKAETKAAPKKAPAKRKPVAKKKPAKKEVEEILQEENEEVTAVPASTSRSRKAPTAFAQNAAEKRSYRIQMTVIAVLMVIGVGSSAAVGFTDNGQIDVDQTIKDRNARMANMVDVDGPVVVAPTPQVVDGGFIGVRPSEAAVPAVVPDSVSASSSATTTEAVASTTDNGTSQTGSFGAPVNSAAVDTATTTVTATESVDSEEASLPEESTPVATSTPLEAEADAQTI